MVSICRLVAVERTDMPVIFITGLIDVGMAVQAMKAGAVEFLTKPFGDEALLAAIRQALERSRAVLGHQAQMRTLWSCYASLTCRERQVVALVVAGLLNKQAAGELGISEITVKAHRGRMMQKMGAKSVVDLVRMAMRLRSERAFLASGQFRSPSPCPTLASAACTMTVFPSLGGTTPAA
jgi:FixJ family two-component response regulator